MVSEILFECGQVRVGEQAPWLSGWTLDGEVFNSELGIASSDTRSLALVFWTTWCIPCRVGLNVLSSSADKLREAGVAVALVNVGESEASVRMYFGNSKPPFTVVLDPYNKSSESFLKRQDGRVKVPLTVLVNRDGIVTKIIGGEGKDYVPLLIGD